MGLWTDIVGSVRGYIRLGLTGVRLKNSSGALAVRNAGDSADAAITASKVDISGDVIDINSDAAGSGADWKYTIRRPSSGMTAAVDLTLPVDDGASGQVLSTNGSGVLSWASAESVSSAATRQTVLAGPVDSSGYSSFGGSTGSATVTASGTLTLSFANGFGAAGTVEKLAQITNPSWTGLSTNGTMYLYVDWNSGSPTTGSTTLAPTYQFGGTYSTTNNQHTFNIQEMVMKVGNGSSASQTYRVFVGEVTVSGNVVTAITWYALQGKFESQLFGHALNTVYTQNHNLGVVPRIVKTYYVCQTAELGYSIDDMVDVSQGVADNANNGVHLILRKNTAVFGTNNNFKLQNAATPAGLVAATLANWKIKAIISRGW